MKICVRCKEKKNLDNFPKAKKNKDGLMGYCKICKSEVDKEYRENNKEKIKKRQNLWCKNNTEYIKIYKKKNEEKIKKYQKEYMSVWWMNNTERIKEYRIQNSERRSMQFKEWRINNLENINKYRLNNKDKINKLAVTYVKNRKKTDHIFKLRIAIRSNITNSFKRGSNKFRKDARTEKILGCTIKEFIEYIQSKFTDGMTLENHGEWHLDHIKPISLANTEKEVIELNHYTNFQPLWAKDNIKKSNKYERT